MIVGSDHTWVHNTRPAQEHCHERRPRPGVFGNADVQSKAILFYRVVSAGEPFEGILFTPASRLKIAPPSRPFHRFNACVVGSRGHESGDFLADQVEDLLRVRTGGLGA